MQTLSRPEPREMVKILGKLTNFHLPFLLNWLALKINNYNNTKMLFVRSFHFPLANEIVILVSIKPCLPFLLTVLVLM